MSSPATRRQKRWADSPGSGAELNGLLGALGRQLGTAALVITGADADGFPRLAEWGRVPRSRAWPPSRQHWASWPVGFWWLWARGGAWETNPAAQLWLVAAGIPLLEAVLARQAELKQLCDDRVLGETLRTVSETLTSTLDLEVVLNCILDELARLVPYDSATVMLLEDGKLHLHALRGYMQSPDDDSRMMFVPEQTPLMQEVLTGDQPVRVPDISAVPGWIWLEGSRRIRSWMAVPLRVQGRATGLFSIDKEEPGFFEPRHAALAAALAPQAAIAIDNARLFRALRSAEQQLRGLSLRVIEAQEAERLWLARELHDQAGQDLLALRAELQILARQIPVEATDAHTQLLHVDEIARSTGRNLRLLSHSLRSHLLNELGLGPALQQHLRDFTGRFELKTELFVDETVAGHLPRPVELAAYRISQEALANVARHAKATSVHVWLGLNQGRLILRIRDDGLGFDPAALSDQRGFGLVGMRERAAALGGRLVLSSEPGQGTEVMAEFPLAGGEEASS